MLFRQFFMKIAIFLFAFGLSSSLLSQGFFATTDSTYVKLVEQAFENLKSGQCAPCLEQYEAAFKSKVGSSLEATAFLVVQHAELPVQEKYFGLLESAAKAGELEMSSFALLVDRIRMRKGEKQLYGSQVTDPDGDGIWQLHPIEDEARVNQRRAEIGMEPLEDYAHRFGIQYMPVKNDIRTH